MTTIYGIHGENITFKTLGDAEHYLIVNYPEYCTSKDAAIDFSNNMIWEDVA